MLQRLVSMQTNRQEIQQLKASLKAETNKRLHDTTAMLAAQDERKTAQKQLEASEIACKESQRQLMTAQQQGPSKAVEAETSKHLQVTTIMLAALDDRDKAQKQLEASEAACEELQRQLKAAQLTSKALQTETNKRLDATSGMLAARGDRYKVRKQPEASVAACKVYQDQLMAVQQQGPSKALENETKKRLQATSAMLAAKADRANAEKQLKESEAACKELQRQLVAAQQHGPSEAADKEGQEKLRAIQEQVQQLMWQLQESQLAVEVIVTSRITLIISRNLM